MSVVKVKSIFPLPISPPDGKSKQSPVPTEDKVAVYATRISQSLVPITNISPVPTPRNVKAMYGQLLTPAPGRLTPTGHGRIKAPPVCIDPALKKVASSDDEFNTAGVCFSPGEAERYAEKARMLDEKMNTNLESVPLNIRFSGKSAAESLAAASATFAAMPFSPEGGMPAQCVSSSSTVVTTSSSASSCGRSSIGIEIANVASVTTEKGPPLEVVRMDQALNSEDELFGDRSAAGVTAMATSKIRQPASALAPEVSGSPVALPTSTTLSAAFTNNLVKGNSSRQGRSLQRWLVHSPTEELVRQVAGTVPITRDGRIILVSASRKMEWILPKGGWDEDETKEECAARETFEEAGLLGRLGGCLHPVDYETSKARKRRLSQKNCGGAGAIIQGRERECSGEDLCPPSPKRAKTQTTTSVDSSSLNDPQLTSSSNDWITLAAHASLTPAATEISAATGTITTTPFDPTKYSYVRLFLFPLYVSSVKSDWPEGGRLRKIVTIDEAIQIMEAQNRLYFKRGLEIVKERGLHLLMKPDE